MRSFLAFLLCFSVAFQGIAYAHAFHPRCPAEQGSQSAIPEAAAAMDDCCNDAETAAMTGKLCKTGQECAPAHAFLIAPFHITTLSSASSDFSPAADLIARTFDRLNVWRPPTSS